MVAMINIGDWVNPLLPGTKCTVLMPINWETITDHSSHLFQYSEIHQKFPVYSLFEMCVAKASFFFQVMFHKSGQLRRGIYERRIIMKEVTIAQRMMD